MGFTPVLPFRGNGRPSVATPFVTRPSGEAGPAEIGIDHAIAGARVFVDGVERGPVGGRWEGTVWNVPFTGTGSTLRVESAAGVRENTGGVRAGNTYDWNSMTVVSGPTAAAREPRTAGPLRIANMPHGGTVEINGAPVSGGRWVNPATMMEWEVDAPLTIRSFSVTDAAGNQRVMTNANEDLSFYGGVTYTGWDNLTPNTATLRVVGPHAGIFVDGEWRGHLSSPESPGTEIWRYQVPTGAHTIRITDGTDAGFRDYPVNIAPGAMQQIVFVPPSAVAPPPATTRPPLTVMGGFTLPRTAPVAVPAPLTVTGQQGWAVFIGNVGSNTPLASMPIPASGNISTPWPVGNYDLGVNNGTRFERRTITVAPITGAYIDTRTFFAAPAGDGPPPTPVRTGLRITGLPAGAVVSIDGRVVTGDRKSVV